MFHRIFIRETLILFLFAVMVSSCEEVLNVDLQGDSMKGLVVEGMITTDTTAHLVKLSWTGDYFTRPKQEMISDADVSISDGENTFVLQEMDPGMYYTDPEVFGTVGKTYTLHIRLADGSEYQASEEMYSSTEIDSIGQSVNSGSYFGEYGYYVLYYGQEPEPAGDYYLYLLYMDDILYTDTLSEVSFVSDEFVNGNYINGFVIYRIRENDLKTDNTKVTLEMYSISEDYYDFLTALLIETVWRGSPWDGPPANIPGNLTNNARGYFRASDVRRITSYFSPTPRM
ncbi:MAG: DUF4249 domain-containing protein [Bacteroidales bacterium]|nr:DUF4249 domain-containing protein [Bacteroidales bacterium]